jgi:hypothetical protein
MKRGIGSAQSRKDLLWAEYSGFGKGDFSLSKGGFYQSDCLGSGA